MAEALPGSSGGKMPVVKRSATGWLAWIAELRRERARYAALTLRSRRRGLIPGVGLGLSVDDWPTAAPDASDHGELRVRRCLFRLRKSGQSDTDFALRARGYPAGAAWSDHRWRRRPALRRRAPRHRRGGE